MLLKLWINKIVNLGVREDYLRWEIEITRKLNLLIILAFINTLIASLFFLIFEYYIFLPECIIILCAAPFVLLLNKYKNYIWSAYVFYLVALCFFVFMNLKMGKESFMILFHFPIFISLVQLFSRKELSKTFLGIGILVVSSLVIIVIGFHYNWYHFQFSPVILKNITSFNIILSTITTFTFIYFVVNENLKQEKYIKEMLVEKEILLAEVFHRVKNNMNIVTSLLNLKKDMSESFEVQMALEDCKNRVYSMALVHQKIFKSNNTVELDFKEYINDLVNDLLFSLGAEDTRVHLDIEKVNISLPEAIPCGLILNELLTNAVKYAKSPQKKLELWIELKCKNDELDLRVKDNGPGLTEESNKKTNTLGLELIKSLVEQIDGNYSFQNENGLLFQLSFKK